MAPLQLSTKPALNSQPWMREHRRPRPQFIYKGQCDEQYWGCSWSHYPGVVLESIHLRVGGDLTFSSQRPSYRLLAATLDLTPDTIFSLGFFLLGTTCRSEGSRGWGACDTST